MRDPYIILSPVIAALNKSGDHTHRDLQRLCLVEVGLRLHQRVLPPDSAVGDAWALFSGYPFAQAWGVGSGLDLRVARHTLWSLGRPTAWTDALDFYGRMDPSLRGYLIVDAASPARQRTPGFASERWEIYDELLEQAPPFTRIDLPTAGGGPHGFPIGRATGTVVLPEECGLAAPEPHQVHPKPVNGGAPLHLTWDEILDTAGKMDAVAFRDWRGTLARARLLASSGGSFTPTETLSVAGIQHLLGIVGAGKSTLRDVLTVHLVNTRGLRVTVVVGDVAELLGLVQLYNTHLAGGRFAAPVIGASGRERHTQRLHRRLAGLGRENVLEHQDPGFAYLNTSCLLNALRPADDEVLGFNAAPCDDLRPPTVRQSPGTDPQWSRRRHACPYWSACPRNHGARALVGANVWVATPAGLVDAALPRPQNAERIRYLELACGRSDLVIVDEADRVQIQLDRMFAPAVPLIGTADNSSLLDDVNTHKIRELARAGRIQLSDRDVESWTAAINTVTAATDRLYAMLVGDHKLRRWVRIGYFNAWTLQLRLTEERYPDEDDPARPPLTSRLDVFRDNPFGDRRPQSDPELVGLASELLHTNYQQRTRNRLVSILVRLFDLEPVLEDKRRAHAEASQPPPRRSPKKQRQTPDEWLEELTHRFEFMLLLSLLEPKLSLVNAMWPRVEGPLRLEFNQMYRGPLDYGPVIPESPMGNMLGFQFLVDQPDKGGVRSGELRFFRCVGLGRELLRAMPRLAEVDGHPPTNLLLMSGSSWAGTSSRYHLPVPVGLILQPDPGELERIVKATSARLEFLRDGDGPPLTISGSRLAERPERLKRMSRELGHIRDDGLSRLQDELLELPPSRRHLLLLVGSYDEAELVADTLHALHPRWRGRVLRLVPDDYDNLGDATADKGSDQHAPTLRRGDIATLRDTKAEILVAPLLAVERGHNILNAEHQAAIGTVYFLARPNPRPDDLGLAVHAVNDWIVRKIDSGEFGGMVRKETTLGEGAGKVRREGRSQWFRVLARTMAWKRLGQDRESVTWDLLVLIWQVTGRLVRGGVPARVVFVDAAFAPNTAAEPPQPDTRETSLLHSIVGVLRPYFTTGSDIPDHDRDIVRSLYEPLWASLNRCLNPKNSEDDTCTP